MKVTREYLKKLILESLKETEVVDLQKIRREKDRAAEKTRNEEPPSIGNVFDDRLKGIQKRHAAKDRTGEKIKIGDGFELFCEILDIDGTMITFVIHPFEIIHKAPGKKITISKEFR